jgi:hypothetical protein
LSVEHGSDVKTRREASPRTATHSERAVAERLDPCADGLERGRDRGAAAVHDFEDAVASTDG